MMMNKKGTFISFLMYSSTLRADIIKVPDVVIR